ncbi:MAG: hypothetical protein M5U34_14985 [Chloroflexi bacterium]|nr:hypothetical protein [Chloroflexota bacterium]
MAGNNDFGKLSPGHFPQAISLTTTWLKQSPPEPVKLFIHLIAPDGGIAAQWDGLTVPWEGWRSGDWLRQTHQLDLPENAAPRCLPAVRRIVPSRNRYALAAA